MNACEQTHFEAMTGLFPDALGSRSLHAYAHKICEQMYTSFETDGVDHGRALLADADRSSTLPLSVDTSFLFNCAYMVFFMQLGFAALCAGSVRAKHVSNTLLMNTIDCCVTGVCFYLIGYGLAFGVPADGKGNGFIGTADFALSVSKIGGLHWHLWFFHWAVAAAVVTIAAGALAERCKMEGYLIYSAAISTFIYPVIAHWLWSATGWLSILREKPLLGVGMIDFAGCSVIHMLGGITAFISAFFCGPRLGRFGADGKVHPDWRGHSTTLVVIGTFILWTGWYGFNTGSTFMVSTPATADIAARASVVTTLGGCAGGVAAILYLKLVHGTWDLCGTCNGILCGLVSITGGAATFEPFAALITGPIAAITFLNLEPLIQRTGVDDAVGASAMHGGCGTLGVLFVGFFTKGTYALQLLGKEADAFDGPAYKGIFYGGNGKLLGCQVIGVILTVLWAAGCMTPLFYSLSRARLLRVSDSEQSGGLDDTLHGGPAYSDWDVDPKTADGTRAAVVPAAVAH